MGTDAIIVAYPPGRERRFKYLDRYSYFCDVVEAQPSLKAFKRAAASELLSAILAAPLDDDDFVHPDHARHWRAEAVNFCERVIRRWGPDTPMDIKTDSVFDYCDGGLASERLYRRKKARKEREKAAKLAVEIDRNKVVYDWLEEKKRRQYSDEPELSLVDFMKSRGIIV